MFTVERADDKDSNSVFGERRDEGRDDTSGVERKRSNCSNAVPVPFHLEMAWNSILAADECEFVIRASDRLKSRTIDPVWDRGVGRQASDGVETGDSLDPE
ncbi:hypothetical protein POI8812_01043 [Pontivivens insulae]|uniref:Uncharacterized protein n=1 Tax=Pontivivens insulae TaxID=1639689 RepID=A0A2R8A9K4_9RHOB|nr:hypothetical protein DFR53_1042 [Pontivivens insulae]SPF28740.1 hypothetical protein POI8812_01043 [Pontivivens insulae]